MVRISREVFIILYSTSLTFFPIIIPYFTKFSNTTACIRRCLETSTTNFWLFLAARFSTTDLPQQTRLRISAAADAQNAVILFYCCRGYPPINRGRPPRKGRTDGPNRRRAFDVTAAAIRAEYDRKR